MKKLLSLFLLMLPLITFADVEDITFNLSTTLRLDENEGQIYLPILKVDLSNQIAKNFSFTIDDDDFLIFANDVSNIEVNSLKSNIKSVSLDSNNKIIRVELLEDISGKVEIQGVLIRTYDEEIRNAKIGYDYNNDDIVDLYSTNVIDLDDNGRYSDLMKPLPVTDVNYVLSKNDNGKYDVKLTWTNSVDLDLYGSFVKVNKNNDYGNIKEQFIGRLDEQTFTYIDMDLKNDIYRLEVYSKDFYYLNTDPFIIILDKDDLVIDTVEEVEVIKDDNIIEDKITDTPEIIELIPVVEDVIEVVKVEKYIPFFVKYIDTLNDFVGLMDRYIDIKKNKELDMVGENSLMVIRNEIVKVTEELDQVSKDGRNDVLRKLISGVNELKEELKK